MINIIRYIITALLLFGVYTETGAWTTIVLFLLALRVELEDKYAA